MAKTKKRKPKYPALQRLKGELLAQRYNYEDAGEVSHLSSTSICQKINGYMLFTTLEIRLLADWLKIPDERIAEYFIPTGKIFSDVRNVA